MLGEVVRFMAVGGLATAVSFVGFNALAHGLLFGAAPLRSYPIVAYVLANVVAGIVAYVGMRLWAFREREASDQTTGVVRFFAWAKEGSMASSQGKAKVTPAALSRARRCSGRVAAM